MVRLSYRRTAGVRASRTAGHDPQDCVSNLSESEHRMILRQIQNHLNAPLRFLHPRQDMSGVKGLQKPETSIETPTVC